MSGLGGAKKTLIRVAPLESEVARPDLHKSMIHVQIRDT